MNRAAVLAVLLVIVIVAGGLAAYSFMLPGSSGQSTPGSSQASTSAQTGSGGATGALSLYITDAPPAGVSVKYLLLNVTGLELRYGTALNAPAANTTSTTATNSTSTNSTATSTTSSTTQNSFLFTVPQSRGTNLNLTSLQGEALLLGATQVPAGNVTEMVLYVTGARAVLTDGSSAQLKVVADGKLMIPFHFSVQADGTTDLTIDIQPNAIHVSQGGPGVLTPVIHVMALEKGQSGTRTRTSSTAFTTAVSNSTST